MKKFIIKCLIIFVLLNLTFLISFSPILNRMDYFINKINYYEPIVIEAISKENIEFFKKMVIVNND